MKLTDTEAKTFVVSNEDKFVVLLHSRQEIPQELLDELHHDLHEWYFGPSKFFVLNLPEGIDLEFEKVGTNEASNV